MDCDEEADAAGSCDFNKLHTAILSVESQSDTKSKVSSFWDENDISSKNDHLHEVESIWKNGDCFNSFAFSFSSRTYNSLAKLVAHSAGVDEQDDLAENVSSLSVTRNTSIEGSSLSLSSGNDSSCRLIPNRGRPGSSQRNDVPGLDESNTLLEVEAFSYLTTDLMLEQTIWQRLGSCTELVDEGHCIPWQTLFLCQNASVFGDCESQSCTERDGVSIGSCTTQFSAIVDLAKNLVSSCTDFVDKNLDTRVELRNLKESVQHRALDLVYRKKKLHAMQKAVRRIDQMGEKYFTLSPRGAASPTTLRRNAQSFDSTWHHSRKKRTRKKEKKGNPKLQPYYMYPFLANSPSAGSADTDEYSLRGEQRGFDLGYDSDPTELASESYIRATMPIGSKKDCEKTSNQLIKVLQDEKMLGDKIAPCHNTWGREAPKNGFYEDGLIEETINTFRRLIWHRKSCDEQWNTRPSHIKAWIEMGNVLKDTTIYPKFSWREMLDNIGKKHFTRFASTKYHSMDLLDICRIIPLNSIDRDRYPFAKQNCCFLVGDLNDAEIFEACSTMERDRIVQGLKLTVARLGAMIFVENEAVYDMFFSPFSAQVPGKAPSL